MTLVQKMDDLIKKLESNDPDFIEKLNKDFDKFTKNKKLKGKKQCHLNGNKLLK